MSEVEDVKSAETHEEGLLPNDFMHYFPFACSQFECGVMIRINKMVMSEFVGTAKTERVQQKTILSKNGLMSHMSRFVITSECEFTEAFSADPTIIVTATYNLSDRLINLKFLKSDSFPRKLIKVLGIIIQFYPFLTSITLQRRIDKFVIYELANLLNISNISEVCLDGTSVSNGNYELLLGDNTGIRILSLARCTLADPIINLFAERLKPPNPASNTLVMLNLSSNRLTDASAEALSSALRVNRCLRNLNLSDNNITDKGATSILDTMLEMTITQSDVIRGREDRFNYLKKKMALMNDLITEITTEETEKYKRHLTKLKSKRKKSATDIPHIDSMSLPADIRRNITTRAGLTAEATLGKYKHPFYPVLAKDGVTTCFGNNTLHSLNLAYTNISIFSVRKILDVMNHQALVRRKPRGLVNVNLEGNNLPVSCSEFGQINALMLAYGEGREDRALSVVATRKRLRTMNTKSYLPT